MLARLAAHFAKLWSARGKATALGGRGTIIIAPPEQASHAAGGHDSAALPKRWPLPPHSKVLRTKRTPPFLTPSQDEAAPVVLRRIRLIAAAAWVAFAVPVLMTGGWRGLLGLTCSGLVTMINFLWLEEIVDGLLQSTPRRHPWRLTVRTLSRFALVGVALLVTIFVARINAVSVLLGFSIVVVGIMGEAVYSTIRSFAE